MNINYKINKTILNFYSDILYRKYVKNDIYYESIAVIFYKMKTKTIKISFVGELPSRKSPMDHYRYKHQVYKARPNMCSSCTNKASDHCENFISFDSSAICLMYLCCLSKWSLVPRHILMQTEQLTTVTFLTHLQISSTILQSSSMFPVNHISKISRLH